MRLTHAFAVSAILVAPVTVIAASPHGKPAGATHVAPATHGSSTHSATSTTHGSTKAATTTTSPSTTTSPIATKIEQHPQLASRLKTMLPSGMSLSDAAAGFRNQGQFIAALHVSQNLGIPFKDLRAQMVDHQRSLGQSIQKLKPTADAATEVHHADAETQEDLK